MKYEYETNRLSMKILKEDSASLVADYYKRNKNFLSICEPSRPSGFYTEEYHARLLKKDYEFIKSRSMLTLWLFKKCDSSRIIGQLTFYNIVPFAFCSCHIGYKGDKDEACKGYITEAVNKGISIIFEDYGIHRIEAHVLPENSASLKVLKNTGFTCEGTARNFLEVNGKWLDHLHLSLVKEDLQK